jgi:hypothetical protein
MIKPDFHKVIKGRSIYPINLSADSGEIRCGTPPTVVSIVRQFWLAALLHIVLICTQFIAIN